MVLYIPGGAGFQPSTVPLVDVFPLYFLLKIEDFSMRHSSVWGEMSCTWNQFQHCPALPRKDCALVACGIDWCLIISLCLSSGKGDHWMFISWSSQKGGPLHLSWSSAKFGGRKDNKQAIVQEDWRNENSKHDYENQDDKDKSRKERDGNDHVMMIILRTRKVWEKCSYKCSNNCRGKSKTPWPRTIMIVRMIVIRTMT